MTGPSRLTKACKGVVNVGDLLQMHSGYSSARVDGVAFTYRFLERFYDKKCMFFASNPGFRVCTHGPSGPRFQKALGTCSNVEDLFLRRFVTCFNSLVPKVAVVAPAYR